MQVVSVALAFQLVSVPVGTERREKGSVRGGKEKTERRNTKSFIRTTKRVRCASCVCVGPRANMRKAVALFASFHYTRLCLHALMIIGRRGPKTNQM